MTLLGQSIRGGTTSVTSTRKVAEPWPEPAGVVQMTRVIPTANKLPLGGTQVSGTTPPVQVFRAAALNVTTAPPAVLQGASMSAGTVMSMHELVPQPPEIMTLKLDTW